MSYTIPIILASYTITIISGIISYHLFGPTSKIKKRLYSLLAVLIQHPYITKYFSLAYKFYVWLFCVGENIRLRFRFNIIISILESITVFSFFFRSSILFLGCYINNSILILFTILFALNGLFRVFIKSGLLINNIDNNHFLQTGPGDPADDEDIIIPWGQKVSRNGNEYVKQNSNVFGSLPPNFDPENPNPKANNELKKHIMNHSHERFNNGQRWMLGIALGSAILTFVVPNMIEYRRQYYETKVRLEQQEFTRSENQKKIASDLRLSEEKTLRAKFKTETAKANAETAKYNADILRNEAKLAKENRLSMETQIKNNNTSIYKQFKDGWKKKP